MFAVIRTPEKHEERIQMTSRYDSKKKCRVGTMDEKQFYAESDRKNGAYFCDLLKAWQKAGGTLR